ncbi:DUF3592 domain-containing protein [Nonomuraea sp. NPDC052129]|uniref:DUF3592 domain-containing protein n=1 Tax=Nonomuraea sp. NPDC052129 TaxID=3154651 RepID=UPI00343824C5
MEDLVPYFPLLFVAFGVLIILGSIKGAINGKQFVRQAQRVPGVVSNVRTTFVGQGEHLRARQWPVLTFTTVEGREITTEAATTSDLGIGSEIEVLYDPQDPTSAVPADDAGGGYGGVVIGLIVIVIGLAFFSAFSGFSGPSGFEEGDRNTRCEIQHPDGSIGPIDCPPGLEIGE